MKFDLKKTWAVIRPILTVLTDLLNKGREAGLWNKKPTIPTGKR